MIRLSNPDEIYTMTTQQLWALINLLEPEEIKMYEKELQEIKNGITIKIPIMYIIKKHYTEYPESRRISVKGYGKHNLIKFYDETDERDKLMREIILENITEEEPTQPRS